jgi:hypothetical protein
MVLITALCILLSAAAVSATEYRLSAATMDQFGHGINYTGADPLVISIDDDVTIANTSNAAIQSAAPVTIRSAAGRTLSLIVNNESEELYGIRAPSVSIESGLTEISVKGANTNGSIAIGVYAETGNVTITGGSVYSTVESACHKNKGIYATRYVVISDGIVTTSQHGGSNTFGIDSSAGASENATGGVIISGGYIVVGSGKGSERNIGIDSKFGTVAITGTPVIFILADAGTGRQNYVYNANITTIAGGNAVVFTSDGGNFVLREDAVLTRNASLIAGQTSEIPEGKTLSVGGNAFLKQPAGAMFLFSSGYGTFEYDQAIQEQDGAVIYTGREHPLTLPVGILVAGIVSAVLLLGLFTLMKRKE